jgi:MMPL family
MSFSILVGLALDYNIFLISRIVEFRKKGWSDAASTCLAVGKTGSIITTAGLIMCVSFAGLLIPPTTVLNQYGFSLFIGVAIDTFVIRTLVVPALFSLFEKLGDVLKMRDCLTRENPYDSKAETPYVYKPQHYELVDVKEVLYVQLNWFPARMPTVVLSALDEKQALELGYCDPHDYLLSLSSSISENVEESLERNEREEEES